MTDAAFLAMLRNLLRFECQQRGWSQSQLARKLHISQAYVSLLLTGKRSPTLDLWLKALRLIDFQLQLTRRRR